MEVRKLMDVECREFDREALEKSWEWLNDPELKELTMTPDFDHESQEKWFESLKNRKDYYIKAGWYQGRPIAIYGLKHITESDGEFFGYIGEKNLWGKTAAVDMTEDMMNYAKSRNLKSIYAITLKDNKRAYRYCIRLGFVEEKEIGDTVMLRLHFNKD